VISPNRQNRPFLHGWHVYARGRFIALGFFENQNGVYWFIYQCVLGNFHNEIFQMKMVFQ